MRDKWRGCRKKENGVKGVESGDGQERTHAGLIITLVSKCVGVY